MTHHTSSPASSRKPMRSVTVGLPKARITRLMTLYSTLGCSRNTSTGTIAIAPNSHVRAGPWNDLMPNQTRHPSAKSMFARTKIASSSNWLVVVTLPRTP